MKLTKCCDKCDMDLPLRNFGENLKYKDGKSDTCIVCVNDEPLLHTAETIKTKGGHEEVVISQSFQDSNIWYLWRNTHSQVKLVFDGNGNFKSSMRLFDYEKAFINDNFKTN